MPRPPIEGRARQDLECIRNALWHAWGIAVHIQTEEDGQADFGPGTPNCDQAHAHFFYTWSYMTGRLQLEGATPESHGKGASIAAAHMPHMRDMKVFPVARSLEQRMQAEDQSVHCPNNPTMAQVNSALQHVSFPQTVLGLVSHPTLGVATSEPRSA